MHHFRHVHSALFKITTIPRYLYVKTKSKDSTSQPAAQSKVNSITITGYTQVLHNKLQTPSLLQSSSTQQHVRILFPGNVEIVGSLHAQTSYCCHIEKRFQLSFLSFFLSIYLFPSLIVCLPEETLSSVMKNSLSSFSK